MSILKNVAIAGASGSVGSVLLKTLIESKKFNIRVLKRVGSTATFPAGTDVVEVDFSSFDSLKAALDGRDAFISTLGSLAIDAQLIAIDAAIAAGVKRILPSEFGSNLDVPVVRALPVFAQKVKVQDAIIEKSKTTDLTYTFVYNSAFLDWGLENNFILNLAGPNPTLVDGGEREFSSTTIASAADAVVGVLTHPEETKNRAVYVSDIIITQKKLLEIARKVAPQKTWEPVSVPLDDITAKANERLAKGLLDAETFVPYLFRAILGPDSQAKFEKNDNELLGIKGKTEKDVAEILERLLK